MKNMLFAEGGELEKESYRWIQNVCRTECAATVEVIDVGYDVSSYGQKLSEKIDVNDFYCIQDFLDYPTGYYIATYAPGAGMTHETWYDRFIEFVRDSIWEWIASQDVDSMIKNEYDDIDDDFLDDMSSSGVDEYAFCRRIADKPFPRLRLVDKNC